MNEKRIFCQTFATDLIDSLSKKQVQDMLVLHFLSALSISKQLNKNDSFYLITDTRGKELIGDNFPYDRIITPLDDYPYQRPLKMSAYKVYSVEALKGHTYIHFDNDVILFKKIGYFEDTIAQSNEGEVGQLLYHNRLKDYDWLLPKWLTDTKFNYNVGVFGFSKDSKIRDEYFDVFRKLSEKNINHLKKKKGIDFSISKAVMQDIYLFLEETLLYYMSKKHNLNVLQVIPDKSKEYPGLWGELKDGKYRNIKGDLIVYSKYGRWVEDQYMHLIESKYDKTETNQELFFFLYNCYKKEIEDFFTKTNFIL